MPATVPLTVNGKRITTDVDDSRTLLVDFLRTTLGLTGTHVGCDTGQCGACTVLLDGKAVKSCMVLLSRVQNAEVTTIEGIAGTDGAMHPMQEAFKDCHGLQCGFCTPGMVMSALDLVARYPNANEDDHPRGTGREFLPVHRLSEYRRGRAAGRRRHEPLTEPS